MAALPIPGGGCVLQDLGEGCRILRGEGAFAGEDAYRQFLALEAVFREGGVGQLVHPVWPARRAWFVSLKLTEQPLPEYAAYSFEFWEEKETGTPGLTEYAEPDGALPGSGGAGGAGEEKRVYTVRKGDTLWGIARRYGVELTALIAANPQIKNPNLIYPGNEVTIP